MNKPRVKLPDKVAAGDVIEIKTLIGHVMETGNRKDNHGAVIPRNIIHTFTATFNGVAVFRGELQSGISANPYIAFFLRVPGSGELEMAWVDDKGGQQIERVRINVT